MSDGSSEDKEAASPEKGTADWYRMRQLEPVYNVPASQPFRAVPRPPTVLATAHRLLQLRKEAKMTQDGFHKYAFSPDVCI